MTTKAYRPNPVQIRVGDTVTWTIDDSTPHTATSGTPSSGPDEMFGSNSDSGGKILTSWQFQTFVFMEAGEFEYCCYLHPNMVGTINVS
ncbi:MAG: plastocyanin/azurin family copper-binding protein [Nitrososphaera sp.]|nr:plastocyanin/azurin family copper-binding protein [Nitrososphaera sp.]